MTDIEATKAVLMTLIENLRDIIGQETADGLIRVLTTHRTDGA